MIKDFVYVYSLEPRQIAVQFDWADYDPQPGLSGYYVRVLQTDSQVAWASPIWVKTPDSR